MKFFYDTYLHIKKSSLTARLLFFLTIISFTVWIVTALVALKSSYEYIETFFDTQQLLLAKTLVTIDFDTKNVNLPATKSLMPFDNSKKYGHEDDDAIGFAVFSAQGHVLLTDGEHGKDFPFKPRNGGFSKLDVDDEAWRIVWLYSADKKRIAAVGQELEYRRDMLFELLLNQLMPWMFVLPLLLAGFGFALHRELRPLREITKSLEQRKAYDTSLLSHDNLPPEIKPLIYALNTLFERISVLLEQERSFVTNAAHELRTPLAGLRIQAEVMAMSTEDPEAQAHALQKILQATSKCSNLVDQLLQLSHLEAKFHQFTKGEAKNLEQAELLAWDELVANTYNENKELAKEKNIQFDYAVHALPTNSYGIAALWNMALRNLVYNALVYTPTNGKVHMSIYAHAICIENSGITIDSEVLPNLGKRFYRPAGQELGGSGLGLAIVKHITKLHGASFSISNRIFNEQSIEAPSQYIPRVATEDGVLVCITL